MSLFNFFCTDEQAKKIIENNRIKAFNEFHAKQVSFAESVGASFGLKKLPVNFKDFHNIFGRKFPKSDPAEFETAFVRGHQTGTERLQYALDHGADRGPEIPPSRLAEMTEIGVRF